jgi:hypothetical protein
MMTPDLGVCKAEKVHGMQALTAMWDGLACWPYLCRGVSADGRSHIEAPVGCIV